MKNQYIVVNDNVGMLLADSHEKDTPKGGVLWFQSWVQPITQFNDRRAAQKAIDRTMAYAKTKGYDWGKRSDFGIVRIVVEK